MTGKSERCRKLYDDIVENSDVVTKHNFYLPETISVRMDPDGKKYPNHLFAYADGFARIKLGSSWEERLIEEESGRPDFVCWLRNPSKVYWALCIPYDMSGDMKAFYPDFIIVRRDETLGYVIDILEPHLSMSKDNLGKAKGLAKYAQEKPRIGRVQLIREMTNAIGRKSFIRLKLEDGLIRQKVMRAINNDELDHIFEEYGVSE